MKKIFWMFWLAITVTIAGYYLYTMIYAENKESMLIGETTHGHYQIELACDTCHSTAFGGTEVLHNACVSCHQEELDAANDSHPRKKFNDPRNVDLLKTIDARYCTTCHQEHVNHANVQMGVTLPTDYCYYCHQDIAEHRPSHEGLEYDSCASAGCHNFHDNRALYERFLVENSGGPWVKSHAHIPLANYAASDSSWRDPILSSEFIAHQEAHPNITNAVALSAHGEAGMSCGHCHQTEQGDWLDSPSIESCAQCHQNEVHSYQQGKHGMRLAQQLPGLETQNARLPMRSESAAQPHSCVSCHRAHEFDRQFARQDACLQCHSDTHSLNFKNSPHAQINSSTGEKNHEDMNVACATCHLPRLPVTKNGEQLWQVQHNQNDNLRPNEKMIRTVCMHCHSLEFSIDALADPELINNNFHGKPSQHIPSIDWALQREFQN